MYTSVMSAALSGIDAIAVKVEADVSDGLPAFSMVGFLSSEVREAQDRVRTSVKSMGVTYPPKRITVNLSPANVRKEGSSFDLPIAAAILSAIGVIRSDALQGVLLVGELGLNGELHPVRGVMQIAAAAGEFGCHTVIVPRDNLAEGSMIEGICVLGAETLQEVVAYAEGKSKLRRMHPDLEEVRAAQQRNNMPDFSEIRGQENVRRAAEIAMAGFHNILMIGPPGAGKSMLAKRLPSIMPRPTRDEILEISRIHSIAGDLPSEGVMTFRPFRSPHHTASSAAMVGGGKNPRPGEISLAHRGVLFLDELPEFGTFTLDTLRQPMEDGQITINRSEFSHTYPARFVLAAAMNPCKCGYWPDRNRCRCTPVQVHKYLESISQPLLDRMDLCVESREPSFQEMTREGGEGSDAIRARVERAAAIQAERYAGTRYRFNADLSMRDAERYCEMTAEAREYVSQVYSKMKLTGRAYLKILRVARTIGDLAGREQVESADIAEAAGYRAPDRKYWGGEW